MASKLARACEAFEQGRLEEAEALYLECLGETEQGDHDNDAALHGLGFVKAEQGAFAEARRCYTTLLDRARRRGDRRAEHVALHQLGMVARLARDYKAALRLFADEHTLLKRRLPDHRAGFSANLYERGSIRFLQGEWEGARQLLQEALVEGIRAGDAMCQACAWRALGELAAAQGDKAAAKSCFAESISLFQAVGETRAALEVEALLEALE
jgi:tetratricopeptide (TPR) repeat protein